MIENLNSGYGQFFGREASGKVFVVAGTSDGNYENLKGRFKPDSDGNTRLFNNITDALSAAVSGRGDKILLSQSFTTAPTLAELATAATKNVIIEQLGGRLGNHFFAQRATGALPASTQSPLFTITGKVKILEIIGEVTTAIQAQANAIKLVANPTVGADVDISGTVESNAAAVGSLFTITGTFANAMIKTVSAAVPSQATPVVLTAGTLDLNAAATNTGSVKWVLRYEPLEPGARVFAA